MENLLSFLKEKNIEYICNEPMKNHTTFKVGGNAEFFVKVKSVDELSALIKFITQNNIPYFILGKGSNLLVSDEGIKGVVIILDGDFEKVEVNEETITAGAGASLTKMCRTALDNSLSGLEFAYGIPGTVGGAVIMNAGAYGGEMKDILQKVTVLTPDGTMQTLSVEELELSYRHSIIPEKGYLVISAVLKLQPGNADEIQSIMDDLKEKRVSKQPLEYPSAGSTFKRPEGYFAGKLIQDAGLRGFRVGGAQVSEKHCGFIINRDQATSTDICQLMQQVSEIVYEKFGVRLEPEVKKIGEF